MEHSLWFKAAGCIAVTLAIETISHVICKIIDKTRPKKPARNRIVNDVLFFPDQKLACFDHFDSPDSCNNEDCCLTHGETSLRQLIVYLEKAQSTLDVCVFVIICKQLARTLVTLLTKGIKVRIITDGEQINVPSSQVEYFQSQGVQEQHNKNSYFMHHKFVVIDRKMLINGSFNWNEKAVMGNHENLFITNDMRIVRPYWDEFQKLWYMFDPSHKEENKNISWYQEFDDGISEQKPSYFQDLKNFQLCFCFDCVIISFTFFINRSIS